MSGRQNDRSIGHLDSPAPASERVEAAGLTVLVQRRQAQGSRGPRYVAEMIAIAHPGERAVVDAATPEELAALVACAVPAFAAAVRLRVRRR